MGKASPYKRLQGFVKLMAVMLVFAMAAPMVVQRCMRNTSPPSPPSSPPTIPIPPPTVRPLGEWLRSLRPVKQPEAGKRHFRVYRWQDAQGNWHYADRPRADGSGEVVVMDRDEGITTLPVFDRDATATVPVNPPPPTGPAEPILPALNPMRIKTKAEEAKTLLEEHFKQQQQVLDGGATP